MDGNETLASLSKRSRTDGLLESIQHALKLGEKSLALFEWVDGSLVHSMKAGEYFLFDEISLAEDAVLERLNSVFEKDSTITIAESGSTKVVHANSNFRIFATMNPGGDFGKKELSPALRNRMTEIYISTESERESFLAQRFK